MLTMVFQELTKMMKQKFTSTIVNKTTPSSTEVGKNGFCLSWESRQFKKSQTACIDLSSGQQIKSVPHCQMKLAFSSHIEKVVKMELMWTDCKIISH